MTTRATFLPMLWLLSLIPMLLRPAHASLSVVLMSGEEDCYRIYVPRHAPAIISGNFDLLDDQHSAMPVVARLENDEKVLWTSLVGDREGVFTQQVEAESGVHRFCLENGKRQFADRLDRNIGWSIRVRPVPRALDEHEAGPDELRALHLAEWASELQEEWETLADHYSFLRTREAVHTELSVSIMGRVMRWTLFEAATLMLIALGQVLYLRKFMETRRYL